MSTGTSVQQMVTPAVTPVIAPPVPKHLPTGYAWTVLSFDIGIKHLAYCILGWRDTITDGTSTNPRKYDILAWDVINLIPDLEQEICQDSLKNGGVCGKLASFRDTSSQHCYCKVHAKNHTVAPLTYRKVAEISDQELNTLLVKSLDTVPALLECNEVMLEHQPSKAPRMKSLSFMLYSYFIIRGIVDRNDTSKMINFRQINDKKKLALYDGPPVTCDLKGKYSQNKFFSKCYCQYMIQDDRNGEWLKFFNSFKKRDDLADCYLQGAWYLTQKCNKPVKTTKRGVAKTIKQTPKLLAGELGDLLEEAVLPASDLTDSHVPLITAKLSKKVAIKKIAKVLPIDVTQLEPESDDTLNWIRTKRKGVPTS